MALKVAEAREEHGIRELDARAHTHVNEIPCKHQSSHRGA